jgi:hypothetical protein
MVAEPKSRIDCERVLSWKMAQARAQAFEGDFVAIAPLLPAYLKRFPESARIRGLTLDQTGAVLNKEKLSKKVMKIVMVIIQMPLR